MITVNNKEITDEEIYQEMQYHPAESQEKAIEKAAQALAIRELLLQEAANLNIQVDDNQDQDRNEKLIDGLFASVIKLPEPDQESIARFYKNNSHRFKKENDIALSFDEAKDAIAEYLIDVSWQNSLREYIRLLILNAKISGVTLLEK